MPGDDVSAIFVRGVGPKKSNDWFRREGEFLDAYISVVHSCADLPGLSETLIYNIVSSALSSACWAGPSRCPRT
eukprot:3039181-Alexandrium_andersonii.AAC.1